MKRSYRHDAAEIMKEWQALSGAGEQLYTVISMALFLWPEREVFIDNLLVRIHSHGDDFSRRALRHGSLKSLLHVALYLPSYFVDSFFAHRSINNGRHVHAPP